VEDEVMMIKLGPSILALLIASGITLLELITTEYPRTYPIVLRNSKKIYVYSIIYGAIAFGITLGIDSLISGEIVTLEGIGLSNLWIRALAIGLTVKAFLHIRLFTIGVSGGDKFPIGIETIVLLFEPWLLRDIEIDHFNFIRTYIQPQVAKYNDLQNVKQLITSNIPTSLPAEERNTFIRDINEKTSIVEAMEKFIRYLGLRSFERAFP
jgi:hypothetical protein